MKKIVQVFNFLIKIFERKRIPKVRKSRAFKGPKKLKTGNFRKILAAAGKGGKIRLLIPSKLEKVTVDGSQNILDIAADLGKNLPKSATHALEILVRVIIDLRHFEGGQCNTVCYINKHKNICYIHASKKGNDWHYFAADADNIPLNKGIRIFYIIDI
jgi:hypothetical protein